MKEKDGSSDAVGGSAAVAPAPVHEAPAFQWRMRRGVVAVIGLRGIPNVMGGIETHCEALYPKIGALLKGSHTFTVLARRSYVPSGGDFKGIRVIPLPSVANKYFEAALHSFLGVLYARFFLGAETVHIHAIGPSLAAPLASVLGMKVVVTHHGEDWRRKKWSGFARMVLKLGERSAMMTAEKVIVISRSLQQRLAKRYSGAGERITYIPNGAPLSASTAADPDVVAELGLTGKPYVLAVGRLVPEKGFQDLITAFEASGVDMRLVICGGADHGDAFTERLTRRASKNVVFTGRLPREKVLALYHGASLFVLPSYHEGLPLVALEAIASGTPIAVSDIDGNRDLGLPDRHYFEAGDIAAIARILRADHTSYRVDADRVLRVFDWNEIAERTARVFRALDA
jgi:glycosyltransferase involved in cell wall biosynthesis